MSSLKDTLYATPVEQIGAFRFDEAVAQVFPDMIQRSVPGYAVMVAAIGLLANRYMQDNDKAYDLGCSWGAASLSMRTTIQARNCKIIAVDNSAAMIAQAQQHLQPSQNHEQAVIEWHCADIRQFEIQAASVVVLNFTLQFISLAERLSLLKRICQNLKVGGVLILSEKLCFEDAHQQALQTEMHHIFKQSQGYSDLEISQKRAALEAVLVPETLAQHQQRLRQAGFSSAEVWFQYFNFASMIALK
jgi:tRNA (cmo5U34)-methyltransferase